MIGGGLIRSLGGWTPVGKAREQGLDHVKTDERILGSPDFVEQTLAVSGKRYEPRYDLVHRGYDLDRIVNRVAEILEMEPHEILSRGRNNKEVVARSRLCFWAARELRLLLTGLAGQLEMTVAGTGYAVRKREKIARENRYRLLKEVSQSFKGVPFFRRPLLSGMTRPSDVNLKIEKDILERHVAK